MTVQSSEATAERIAGPEAMLLIEAPAGHGKTYQAAHAAAEMGKGLERGQTPLLLSHTNSARAEFERHFRGRGSARAETLDSLACSIVDTYATRFGINRPMRPEAKHLGQPSFAQIRRWACELLRDAPAVAQGLAWRHPVILGDEYQDTACDHHELLWRIRQAGPVRVRLFGDGLQAIFDFAGDLISWDDLVAEHGALMLPHGYRWDATPELRDFIAAARAALVAGEQVPLRDRPTSVQVHSWSGAAPGIGQRGHCPACDGVLRGLKCSGHVAHLVRNGSHAYGLAKRLPHVMKLYESGDPSEPLKRIEQAQASAGEAPKLILLLIDTLRAWGGGVEKDIRTQLERLCQADGVHASTSKRVPPWLPLCELVYDRPDAYGWLRAFKLAVSCHKELGWKIVRRDAAALFIRIPDDAPDLILAVQHVARARRDRFGPTSKVMTVHRSKGMQFDVVVLPYVAAAAFPDDDDGRKHLYVALTRAQRQLHLLVPTERPSPLFTAS
jgi:hypothetical protein